MKTFNKSLHPMDYAEHGMGFWLYLFDNAIEGKTIPYMPNPHLHRRWEYAMAMEFLEHLRQSGEVKTILDVGGAGSLFAPIAASQGYEVTVIDPDPCVHMLAGQLRVSGGKGQAVCAKFDDLGRSDFDVVVSLSAIEHVEKDEEFFDKFFTHALHGVFLTTDFHMSGMQRQAGHLRTYSPKTLKNKLAKLMPEDWVFLGEPEWIDNGAWVFDYNFASIGVVSNVRRN